MEQARIILCRVAVALLLPAVFVLTLVCGSASSAHASAPIAPTVRTAGLDDFSFDSYHADFALGRDDEGRSTLHTTETFVARFPDFDQNRGFIRSIPVVYNGFTLDITDLSVTDETGTDRPFDYEYAGDFVDIIMAVPDGQFVRGEQTYVLDYSQKDVTAHFADTNADEFYWDLNGTDSRQPFGMVSATLTLVDGLETALNGGAACYRGPLGSDTQCTISKLDEATFSVNEQGLAPGENVSIAVGFEPGTFAPAPLANRIPDVVAPGPFMGPPSFLHNTFGGLPVFLWSGIASFVASIVLFIRRFTRKKPKTGRAIIAQYDPPAGVSVALSADLMKADAKAMTSTLLDFAVRRRLRLIHDAPSNVYGVQSIDTEGLLPVEKRVYDSIFQAGSPAGTVYWFDSKSTRLGDAAARLKSQARAAGKKRGFYGKTSGWATAGPILLLLAAIALFGLQGLASFGFPALFVIGVVGFISFVWVFIGSVVALAFSRPPLTHEGALLHDYLMGLKEFIRLAEADRIRMLQSVSGAIVDENRIVQIYERLLPYAVIFGYEDEWQVELAKYYRESVPEWIAGDSSFSSAIRFSALNSIVSSSPATRASSSGSGSGGSFSSSSGGSRGGGFSGGGGGGGGSRGI